MWRGGNRRLDDDSHKPLGRLSLTGGGTLPCPRARRGECSWKNSDFSVRIVNGPGSQGGSPGWEVGREHHQVPKSCPSNLSSPGYLLLGLLAMLLTVETFSELPQVRTVVKFFGSSDPSTAEDQVGIIGQDELALSTLSAPTTPSGQAPAC